jgi:hypothetical protein
MILSMGCIGMLGEKFPGTQFVITGIIYLGLLRDRQFISAMLI